MLLSAHEEYNALLEDEARDKEDEWFVRLKTKYFPLKGRLHAN